MDSGIAGRRKQVESALLDYHRSPGKYPLLLRRPQILFSSIKEVLQFASGRMPDGTAAPGLAVQRAAGFFVRTALLYPAADHYALLGLDRTADAAAIKERYRQMMRLMHPDFASSAAAGGNWPSDAASRINQAYEVLASDAQRRSYDEKLGSAITAASQRSAGTQSVARAKAATASAASSDPRQLLKRMAGAFGVLGAVALAASLLARGPDRESLVQRATPRPPPAVVMSTQRDPAAAAVANWIEPAQSQAPGTGTEPTPSPAHAAAKLPAVHFPVAIEAPSLGRAATPSTSLRAASIAPMQPSVAAPPPGGMMAVSVDAPEPQAPAAPATAAPPSRSSAVPAVTMAEAHGLLSMLLQQMESGSGERILSGLDRSVRNAPSAQALARQYNGLLEGSRSVKVSNVLLRADPREDRLLVKGQVLLDIGDFGQMRVRELSLEAEFAKRNGTVVMTRLAPAQVTGAAAQ